MLKEKRASTDAECEERQRTRQLEMEACSKAFVVLSFDKAHGLLAKTFNFAVIQEIDVHRTAAANVLPAAGLQNKSPRPTAISNANDGAFVFKASHLLSPSLSSRFPDKSELAFRTGRRRSLAPHKTELAVSTQDSCVEKGKLLLLKKELLIPEQMNP